MLEMVREYFEAGYEIMVDFYGYYDPCADWQDVLDAFAEVEEDEYMHWRGYEVDHAAHEFWLFQGSDD